MSKQKQSTLRQQIEAFKSNKEFINDGFFYFFDWFCNDRSLKNKAVSLMPKVIKFSEIMGVDLDKHYVIFKNNCPMFGTLYDDFRICDIKDEEVVWTVTPKTGHPCRDGLVSEVWGSANDFNEAIVKAESWKDLLLKLQIKSMTPNQIKEQIQEDLITLLEDQVDSQTVSNACQIVIDNLKLLEQKKEGYTEEHLKLAHEFGTKYMKGTVGQAQQYTFEALKKSISNP
jgi:hypothetical protein